MLIINLNRENLNDFFDLFKHILTAEFPEYSDKVKNHFLTRDYSKESFEFNIDRPYRKVLTATENDRVVGYLVADQTYGGVGFISFLGVHGEFRKKGVASALFSEYEKFCKEKKAHMMKLYTFERIIPFYDKLGFQKIGEEKEGYWGTNNQVMGKKIGEWNEETLDL